MKYSILVGRQQLVQTRSRLELVQLQPMMMGRLVLEQTMEQLVPGQTMGRLELEH